MEIIQSEKYENTPAKDLILLNSKILRLKEYFKTNKKDFTVSRVIIKLVAKKKRILKYISKVNKNLFKEVSKIL